MTYWTIRLTELHNNKEKVVEFVEKYWAEWYFIVLEISSKDKEHYHILVKEDTDIKKDAIRKRLHKHGYSGNRQHNTKELDTQRVFTEFVPYMCKDIRKRDQGITWFKKGYQVKIKKMKRTYLRRAKEYKNGVLKKITAFIESKQSIKEEEGYCGYTMTQYIEFVLQYYLAQGLCIPDQWRAVSLAQTMWLNRDKDRIKELAHTWYNKML